jgi:hypothetical protein
VTDPTRRTTRPATDGPVMGDHPELEADDVQRAEPVNDNDGRSPLLIVGIVALVILVVVILLLVF